MSQLQVIQLLEAPELPVHRAPRPQPLPEEEKRGWWRLSPSERGRHDGPRHSSTEEQGLLAEPRAYVRGETDDETIEVTLQSLAHLNLAIPDLGRAQSLRFQVNLGRGQSAFFNVRSSLWSWRPHRQSGMFLHTHGPPVVGRNLIFEQRVGLVTVLQGCRVMALTEEDRMWGFTLGSLEGQVYRLWERLMVEWREDDSVILHVTGHHEVAQRGFGLIGPMLSSARRNIVQDYARGMAEWGEF